jgi:hypothetical protein
VLVAAPIGFAPPAAAKTCDGKKVLCKIGDTGPGGGVVFYDAGSRQPWGRYLEAPGKVKGKQREGPGASWADTQWQWCPEEAPGYNTVLPTGTAIGTGRANTQIVIDACGADAAAGVAAAFRGGGKDDWFLPSKNELNALYRQRKVVGGLAGVDFWSSSQVEDTANYAWSQLFILGSQYYSSKDSDYRVRPVRAF